MKKNEIELTWAFLLEPILNSSAGIAAMGWHPGN
jgi:hypothetical protein